MSLYVDIEKRLGAFRLQSKFEVADETLALLMGDDVEPRRDFIEKNAKLVADLDI